MNEDLTVGVPRAIVVAVAGYVAHRHPPNMLTRAIIGNSLEDACAYSPKEMTMTELRAST